MKNTPLTQSCQRLVIELKILNTGSSYVHWSHNRVTTVHVSSRWHNIGDNKLLSLIFRFCSSEDMVLNINFIIGIKDLQWVYICKRSSRHAESDPFAHCTAPCSYSFFSVWPISNWNGILRIIPRSFNSRTDSNSNRLCWFWRTFEYNQASKSTWKCRISYEIPTCIDSRPSDPRRMTNIIVEMESNVNCPSFLRKITQYFNSNGLTRNSVKTSVMVFSEFWSG